MNSFRHRIPLTTGTPRKSSACIMTHVRLPAIAGLSVLLLGGAAAAPPKKPAKAPAKPANAAAKPPLKNSGGAGQISALEGDLVGREYVNGTVRFRFEAPRVSLAWKGAAAEAGKVWVVIPFEASNATKSQL